MSWRNHIKRRLLP